MQELPPERWAELALPATRERAAGLLAPHARHTGRGGWWVDRWPSPRLSVVRVGGNLGLAGDPDALDAEALRGIVAAELEEWDRLFVEAPGALDAAVREALAPVQRWERVNLALRREPRPPALPPDAAVRRLAPGDAAALEGLPRSLHWIADPWDGPAGLARSGRAFGAWVEGRLASVACAFFVGAEAVDLGVVTEPAHRGRGLVRACAARVAAECRAEGRTPTWSTWPANRASLRVASRLGFERDGEDHCWIAGKPMDPSPR